MHVVATAGHVDHGKSRLVRALTGMEPDRWAEERRRGMTIDLGFAWMDLDGRTLAFVDVPGHERFIGNMLAGVGPAPAVLFVVAADQGWQAQSDEHLAALRALGLERLLLAVTRSELADPAPAMRQAGERLREAGVDVAGDVAVSAETGSGLDDLRAALSQLVSTLPTPSATGRVRMWVDRAFTVRGAGTVVTGTLAAGSIGVGDELELHGRRVRVRGLQSLGTTVTSATAAARVAVNLRGVDRAEVSRGDVLLTPNAWWLTNTADVALDDEADGEWMLHVGTAAVPVAVRPLGTGVARLRLTTPLPLASGDRAVLREPGTRMIVGAQVLDADPPALDRRRGAAARRATALATPPDVEQEITRRGAVTTTHLAQLGFDAGAAETHRVGDWLVAPERWHQWTTALVSAVEAQHRTDPLAGGLREAAAVQALALPDPSLLAPLAGAARFTLDRGLVRAGQTQPSLGAAEAPVAALEQRLERAPFHAPERPELETAGLGRRQLAVAVRLGRLLELPGGVVLRADAPQLARALLAAIEQPFTLSQARIALNTTRRVAVPLLEHLDALGLTERVDDQHRRVV